MKQGLEPPWRPAIEQTRSLLREPQDRGEPVEPPDQPIVVTFGRDGVAARHRGAAIEFDVTAS